MKAKKKTIEEKTPSDFSINMTARLKVLKTVEPVARKAGVKLGSVAELVMKLKQEAGVI